MGWVVAGKIAAAIISEAFIAQLATYVIINAVAAYAFGTIAAKLVGKPKATANDQGFKDVTRETVRPRQVVYGTRATGGPIVFVQNDGNETQRDEIEAQRDLVTSQKDHITEIYGEIQSSINYAQKIQAAVLPSETSYLPK